MLSERDSLTTIIITIISKYLKFMPKKQTTSMMPTILTTVLKHSMLLPLFRKPILLSFIFSVPLIVGFLLSVFVGWDTAFQRSGAVLVMLVGYAAYLNYFVSKQNDGLAKSRKIGENANQDPQRVINLVKEQHPDLPEKTQMQMVAGALKIKQAVENKTKELDDLSESIINTEAAAGAIGTIVWAFGDLPFS